MFKIWEYEEILTEEIIVPLHKEGEEEERGNCRGKSLLSIPYKTVSKVILNRLQDYSCEIIQEHKAGFMKGWTTTNQIFGVKEMLSKY